VSGLDVREVEELARAYALINAVEHGGKAQLGPVMGKLMAVRPEWRKYARDIASIVRRVVEEVNSLSLEEQKRLLEERYRAVLEEWERARRERAAVEKKLPPLPGAVEGKVVTRFAPNPDFAIHLGNARPAVLSYEYARMYKGKFILRFEDTDPRIKAPLPEAYEAIREDLRWLGIRWDEEYIQSLRMEVYYEVARKLIERGGAYVDDMPGEEFRRYRDEGRLERYPPRLRSVEDNLELWDKMLEGAFGEGEAVLRVKTDPSHPDPSVRDWVAFRIIDTSRSPHPLVGDRYVVWPTYNFAAAVDDHLLGITHVLRAREHMQNTVKQIFLYKHMGWQYPHVIHFGRLKLEGMIMSKSAMKEIAGAEGLARIDDPRFATIAGLRRRGIVAETIKKIILDVGVKQTDASISYANLASLNRSIVDPKARRYMVVVDPIPLLVVDLPWEKKVFEIPFHPGQNLGSRRIVVEGPQTTLYISASDLSLLRRGAIVRLMEAFNIEIVEVGRELVKARYHSESLEEARRHRAQIIQWVPAKENVEVEVLKPEGLVLSREQGLGEPALASASVGEICQFVRYGFVRIDQVLRGESESRTRIVAIYAHD